VKDTTLEDKFNPDEFYKKLIKDLRSGSLSEDFSRLEKTFTMIRRLRGVPLDQVQNETPCSSTAVKVETKKESNFSKSN